MITKKKAQEVLDALVGDTTERIKATMVAGKPSWDKFDIWRQMALDCIEQIYLPNHRNLIEFSQIRFSNPTANESSQLVTFIVGLQIARERLIATRASVELYWGDDMTTSTYPIIFLSCSEKAKKISNKLRDFLTILGAKVIIVSEEPNLNFSPASKVEYYMSQCNCGIVLITADEELESGQKINRRNIDNEIGLLSKSENINPRIIILNEKSVKRASNHAEKVHISFNRSIFGDDVYPALVKELKAFGYF